jgi:hypothetical protein
VVVAGSECASRQALRFALRVTVGAMADVVTVIGRGTELAVAAAADEADVSEYSSWSTARGWLDNMVCVEF